MWLAAEPFTSGTPSAPRLRYAALDQEAELRLDSAVILLDRAIATDPAYFPAYYDYIRLMVERGAHAALARRLDPADPRGGAVGQCAALAVQRLDGPLNVDDEGLRALRRQERASGTNACNAYFLAVVSSDGSSHSANRAEHEHYAPLALRLAPDLGAIHVNLAHTIAPRAGLAAAEQVITSALQRPLHTLEVLTLNVKLVELRLQSGDTAAARALDQRLAVAVARDARPGVRYAYGNYFEPNSELNRVALARAHGAWPREFHDLGGMAHLSIDRGDPVGALPHLDRQLAIADSVGSPALQLIALVRRGRAYSKLARLAEAERDLVRALRAAPHAFDHYMWLEAYHNLAHTYESAGRWSDAAGAADQMVRLGRTRRYNAQRVMSLHDAGTIRWKAGWHAAAERDFAEMVGAIDDMDREHFWAGEYFERVGDLQRAVGYYRRVASGTDETRAFAALALVYEQLGRADSAAHFAARHDALREFWTPAETPVMPALLARAGQLTEAVALSREWTERQLANRNIHGATTALQQLAQLLLEHGRPAEALRAAARAESLAAKINLVDELIQARRLQGTAQLRLGNSAAGLDLLEDAARNARSRPTTESVVHTHVAFGAGLSATGSPEEAIEAFARAARAVETITASLHSDADRAGYREQHLAPFDGAVQELMRLPPTAVNVARLADWSRRRKAAALALSSHSRSSVPPNVVAFSLDRVQRALPSGAMLLDYSVVDTMVAVLAVTRHATLVKRLAVTEPELRELVSRLRAPLVTSYNGRIDIGRAQFEAATAYRLYQLLLEPVLAQQPDHRQLIISVDGPLHYLPFEILLVAPPAPRERGQAAPVQEHYLLDDLEVVYVPSAEWITRATRAPPAVPANVLVLAGAAPGAQREAAVIAAAFPPGVVKSLSDTSATETALRAARGFDVIHVAAHALANGRDPLASHLRLHADSLNDGYLHVAEIGADRQSARLVVLSACETTIGPLLRGEGLLGLARGFIASGAGAVVATNWPIGDQVRTMEHFYRLLATGAAPAAALRTARLALRQSPETAHPLFWGGIVLIAGSALQH